MQCPTGFLQLRATPASQGTVPLLVLVLVAGPTVRLSQAGGATAVGANDSEF